ncbi:MAG: 1,4-alpha-glucan branching enzyme [Verrucomicrobia bacterium A1]|nr:MAG: 1,4-alpha-glucan branching enzyme [Verrucomicrobia bacterium A1]
MKPLLDEPNIRSIVEGTHGAPYSVLGVNETGADTPGLVIRALQLFAQRVEVLRQDTGEALAMNLIHNHGLFELFLPNAKKFPYRLRMTGHDGHVWELDDPYRFPLQITDFDLHLFGEGTHFRTYEKMGAHPATVDGVEGVHFAVWAPNAQRVSVVGWFNRWDGRHHPMQSRGGSGLWELFIPALQPGDLYKYEIKGQGDFLATKADPYAFFSELRPRSASVVWNVHKYAWQDQAWMDRRRSTNWHDSPISVYEVHLSSWRRVPEDHNRWLSYRELADQLIPYVKKLGYTHIEMLPISEHPFDGSWGYQTIGYYASTSRHGTPDDFMYFVDRCHQEGIGVLLDWVPAHFPKDGHGLAYFDGSHLYEHADPRKGEHKDWGTLIFNYGRNEVRTFLLSNAVYLADVFHVDGLRVDAVASMLYLDYSRTEGEWIPNQYGGRENLDAVDFLKKFNEIIHAEYPGFLTFAEESTAWPMVSRPTYLGGLGFDFKWNMGWMHDTLVYMTKEPVHRKFHHHELTFSLLYAFTENFILPFSHDEVVHGKGSMLNKMPGDLWQKFANLRLLYSYMFAHPGKKLLFMGGEFGQWREWNHHESLDWDLVQYDTHSKLENLVQDLHRLYREIPALHQIDFSWEGFEWIDLHDWEQSIISFFRRGRMPQGILVCVCNFTPVPRHGYRIGVPQPGVYEEVLNSDADRYGGSNFVNSQYIHADAIPWMGRAHSLPLNLPPLGSVYLRLQNPA